MLLRRLLLAGAMLVSALPSARAQSVGKMLGDDFKNAGKDIWAVWTSPFHASGKDWGLFGATVAAAAAMLPADKPVERWAQRNESAAGLKFLDPLRRHGILFSGKYVVPPALGLYIVGVAIKNEAIRDGVMGCAASWGSTGIARRAIYLAVGRERPDTSPDDNLRFSVPNTHGLGKNGWQYRSLPAGHFANVAGCASFLSHRFDMGLAEPALYAVALGVALGRTLDHGHWMSDNVFGGVMGYAAGSEIARRSLRRRAVPASSGLIVQPDPTGAMTFQFNWKF